MTRFTYKVRDQFGVSSAGELEAESSKEAALQLDKRGLTPISIKEKEKPGSSFNFSDWLASVQGVKGEEIVVFCRQLASVLEAGVPLLDGLDAVQEQLRNRNFREVVIAVRKDIEGGSNFSDALAKHNKIFSNLVVNMVRAGEKAGILDQVLERIAELLDKDLEMVNKVKTATRYPLIVVVTLAVAFVIMIIFVIPRFAALFSNFRVALPWPTQLMIVLNNFVVRYWIWLLVTIFSAAYLWRRALETERGRYSWDKFVLSTPVFGPLFLKIYLSRFARMLSAMVHSGIPILQALATTSETVENKVITRVILKVRDEVSQGKSLSEPMRGSHVFPPIAISMIAIGEKAGTLEQMLDRVGGYFEREANYTIDNLTPLLEPILIFGLGALMLIFALGIFLPMWDLVRVYQSF